MPFIFATSMDNKCINVGIVNYLNVQPLLYGLQKMPANEMNLQHFYPAQVAEKLLDGSIDIGLVPVAIIPQLPFAKIIGNHCIASNNNVASVCLFSKVPLHEISTVLLDFQSRTSVQLVQILFKHFWKKEVQFIPANEHFINEIKDTTAAVIIGDRALQNLQNFPFIYDLAEAWKSFTGLPFVFAAWVSNKAIESNFIIKFEIANALGLNKINEIVAKISFPFYDLHKYYTENISYTFDYKKLKGLERFLEFIKV